MGRSDAVAAGWGLVRHLDFDPDGYILILIASPLLPNMEFASLRTVQTPHPAAIASDLPKGR